MQRHDVLAVAAEAKVDPVTVTRRLEGKPGKRNVRARVDAALRKLGFGDLIPNGAPSTLS